MLAGLLIGMGIVLPGVSGGVIAVILNVYDKLIFAINNFSENKKDNSIFLAKMIISLIVGAIISANLLTYFFEKYLVEMSYLFICCLFFSRFLFPCYRNTCTISYIKTCTSSNIV